MKSVAIHEAETNFSSLLAEVESTGETVLICRHGKPVADLVRHRKSSRLKPHPVMRDIDLRYDPIEPLAGDEWDRE